MLNNQIEIPGIGLGVFQIPDTQTAEVVKAGIVKGYRLIDTAQIYMIMKLVQESESKKG